MLGRARLILGLVVALTPMALGSLLGSGAAEAASSTVAVLDCANKAVVRPTTFTIACADDNSYLQRVDWKTWTTTSATATATYVENTCTPYCAAGKFVDYAAALTLSVPKSSKFGKVFTKLHVTYRDKHTTDSFTFALLTS